MAQSPKGNRIQKSQENEIPSEFGQLSTQIIEKTSDSNIVNKNSLFLILISVLTTVFVYFFSKAKDTFGDVHFLSRQVRLQRDLLKQKDLQIHLAEAKVFDIQQEVLAHLPKSQTENIATLSKSNFRIPASVSGLDLSGIILARGKSSFNKKNFAESISTFKELELKFPSSPNIPEAVYLKSESYFLTNRFEDCLKSLDTLVQHYPHAEVTGYGLIRMGQILEIRKRDLEAREVYRTVLREFNYSKLQKQAQKLLEENLRKE